MKNVSNLGEKALIKHLLTKIGNQQGLSKDTSDDAALIPINDNEYLVLTTDTILESTHIPRSLNFYQIGWKIVSVNLSDLAAMAAKPTHILLTIGLPSTFLIKDIDELYDGVLDACKEYNIQLIGGDTIDSEELLLSATALGKVDKDKVLLKYGYKTGDKIFITGPLGLAATALQDNTDESLLKYLYKPPIRIKEAQFLAKQGVKVATDISDGLASELYELFNSDHLHNPKSDLGFLIYSDNLPIDYRVDIFTANNHNLLMNLLLHVGEDFELLLIIPNDLVNKIDDELKLYPIGEVTNTNKIEIKYGEEKQILSSHGYQHLTKNKKKNIS